MASRQRTLLKAMFFKMIAVTHIAEASKCSCHVLWWCKFQQVMPLFQVYRFYFVVQYKFVHWSFINLEQIFFFVLFPKPFHPMVNLVCSADLRMFLCALYAPVCTEYGRMSMPCRSVCQRAKDECHKLMEIFGVAWPDDMECSR